MKKICSIVLALILWCVPVVPLADPLTSDILEAKETVWVLDLPPVGLGTSHLIPTFSFVSFRDGTLTSGLISSRDVFALTKCQGFRCTDISHLKYFGKASYFIQNEVFGITERQVVPPVFDNFGQILRYEDVFETAEGIIDMRVQPNGQTFG